MEGFKGFQLKDGQLYCRDFHYEVGKTYELGIEKLKLCNSGFHYCEKIKDVFKYYQCGHNIRYCSITAFGNIQTHKISRRDKYCSVKIRIDKLLDGVVDGLIFKDGLFICENKKSSPYNPIAKTLYNIPLKNDIDGKVELYNKREYTDGKVEWYNQKRKLHREDGPAVEIPSLGIIKWYKNGKVHRENGPAYEEIKSEKEWYKEWYINGKLHREDGPAYEDAEGVKEWYKNGNLHREDGPAIEYSNGTTKWYINGKLHREDGPAIEYTDGYKEWYKNGKLTNIYDPFSKEVTYYVGKEIQHSINGERYKLLFV